MWKADGPYLVLQSEDGRAAFVKGQSLSDSLRDLPRQPRLVVLASCESGDTENSQSETTDALAPMLAAAGAPAVVAMRGKISMETVKQIMPAFFRELIRDGQIDRAMAAARSVAAARNRPDFWMPALYLRLRNGCIWAEGPSRKLVMAAAGLAAALLIVLAASAWFFFQSPLEGTYTEIVVDRSASMGNMWEGKPKLDAAKEAAGQVLYLAPGDAVALRQFGGPCIGDNTGLDVKFGRKNANRVQKSLDKLRPTGQPSLARAVIAAATDFSDRERFKNVVKRIIVITGSDDLCLKDPKDLIATIQQRIESEKTESERRGFAPIELNFRFVGLGLTLDQRQVLESIAKATHGEAIFVDHRTELPNKVRELALEPLAQKLVVELLNAGVDRLKGALDAIGNSDYAAAEAGLKEAGEELTQTEKRFGDLRKRQSTPQLKQLFETASKNRDIHRQLLTLAEKMLSQAKLNDDGYEASRKEYIRLKNDYNRNGETIDTLLEQLKKS